MPHRVDKFRRDAPPCRRGKMRGRGMGKRQGTAAVQKLRRFRGALECRVSVLECAAVRRFGFLGLCGRLFSSEPKRKSAGRRRTPRRFARFSTKACSAPRRFARFSAMGCLPWTSAPLGPADGSSVRRKGSGARRKVCGVPTEECWCAVIDATCAGNCPACQRNCCWCA